jgi:two-component system chemotaxis response regulator CheY
MTGQALEGLKGLVVDDVPAIRSLIARLATGLGCAAVSEAEDVASAWSILTKEEIDFILLDYDLDGETGLKLVRRLRKSATCDNREVPIILLTAHADVEIVQASVAAGANAYLVKPVMPDRLAERILHVIRDSAGGIAPSSRLTEVSWKANGA